MIRTTIKITICLMLLLSTVSLAQTATTITVGGTDDKYYPVTFTDPEWATGKPTEIYIGRPDIHMDGSLKGSTLASFKYHTTRWGNQSGFIYATIEKSQNASFFAGWADATTGNASYKIVIWLKGGGMSYLVKSVSTVSIAVHDGVQNALPFLEENGPARSYKTTTDSYVITGSMSSSGSLVAGNGTFLANVGIGTPTPQANLDIFRGFDGVQTKAFKMFYQGSWGTAPYASGFRFLDIESSEGGKILQLNGYGIGIGYDPPNYGSSDKLYINGNVGIGTASPNAKLEISSNTDYNHLSLTKNTIEGQKGSGIVFRNLVNNGELSEIAGIQAKLLDGGAGSVKGSLSLYTKNDEIKIEAVTISSQGNMGIGTTTPNAKLAVNGKIRAQEIKVETANWPDYVFEEGYQVGTLEELERYIKANKHLPEMPSAKEAEANGVELGEMNKLLLKKVEELTLHLIEKDKQLTDSNKRLSNLEAIVQQIIKK